MLRKPPVLLAFILLVACQNQSDKSATLDTIPDTDARRAQQANPYAAVDVSPMDMCYFPADYPLQKMTDKTNRPPVARIIYSRPHLQGRKMFGNVLKYGQPWRLGANEASEVQLFQEISIQDKKIAAGRYSLYCIPFEDKWTIVFNSKVDAWGLRQDPSKDLHRFDIPISFANRPLEYFSMVFEKTDTGADLVMAWDNVIARLPLQFSY